LYGVRAVRQAGHASSKLWRLARGEQILELYHTGQMSDIIPERAAIYLWRLSMRPPAAARATAQALTDWLDSLLTLPLGEVTDSRVSHALRIASLEVRGGGLGEEKKRVIQAFSADRRNRQWLLRFLETLGPQSTALYAGETGNLYSRTKQHLNGDSDFGLMVREHIRLSWEMFDLHYVELGDATEQPSEVRKALEYMTAVMTVSAFTKRPG
jgi:hypothetical protein